MAHPGPQLIIPVSSYEVTGSNYPPSLDKCQPIPWRTPPSPPPPMVFHKASLTNFCHPFILLGGEESEREKCSAQEQNTLTRQGYKGTPDPESTLLIIRPPFLPQEGRVYAQSFLIRNKFCKIVIFKKRSLVKTNKKACL